MYFEAKKPINDEIKKQEKINKELKNSLIQKVKEIQYEDNEFCIQEFKIKRSMVQNWSCRKKRRKIF